MFLLSCPACQLALLRSAVFHLGACLCAFLIEPAVCVAYVCPSVSDYFSSFSAVDVALHRSFVQIVLSCFAQRSLVLALQRKHPDDDDVHTGVDAFGDKLGRLARVDVLTPLAAHFALLNRLSVPIEHAADVRSAREDVRRALRDVSFANYPDFLKRANALVRFHSC